jgi:hypothetical protein
VAGIPAAWSMDDLLFTSQAATVPTLNQWGMIIFMMFAGLGAIYFLRRKSVKS